MFCAATFAGYTAYEKATMTDAERMMLANIEALTDDKAEESSDDCDSGGSGCELYINKKLVFSSDIHHNV